MVSLKKGPLQSFVAGFLAAIGLSPAAVAQEPLAPAALFARCYTHLTGARPRRNHPLFQQVRSGQTSAIAACSQILDDTLLQPETASVPSAQQGMLVSNTTDSQLVLREMQRLHETWMPAHNLRAVAKGSWNADLMENVLDPMEPAGHLTRVLLTQAPFSEAFTGDQTLELLRDPTPSPTPSPQAVFKHNCSDPNATVTYPTPLTPVLSGKLVGIRKLNPSVQVTLPACSLSGTNYIYRGHLGGGILGTQGFLALTLNTTGPRRTDGGIAQNRSFSAEVFKTFLCRTLPVLRRSDAQLFVQTEGSGRPPFRTTAGCMQCHASIDPMAGAARHVTFSYIGNLNSNEQIFGMSALPITAARQPGMVNTDGLFSARPRTGDLYYRTSKGDLVATPIEDLSGLGQALVQQDDLYSCMASRYVGHFLGAEVPFFDPGDPGAPTLTPEDKETQAFVVSMGALLKQTQSSKELIKAILRSKLYQRPDFTMGASP